MVNLDDINTKDLIEYLNNIQFDQEKITEILQDDDPEYSEFKKAFFLMLCYNKGAVIQRRRRINSQAAHFWLTG